MLRSWGNYPRIDGNSYRAKSEQTVRKLLEASKEYISYGNGRSYGDSALAEHMIHVLPQNYMLDFDETTGVLHLQAGVLLSEILDVFAPRGWFLMITPGTKYITIGGAIASDIHGKNHHRKGCFSECVLSFRLMLADGSIVECSRELNRELFRATCGGMGLTGIILDARVRLKKIESCFIEQTVIKTKNLQETFEAFEKYNDVPYSVAWIDCLAKGKGLGKCLLMVGDFSRDGQLENKKKRNLNIPFFFPSLVLNKWTVKLFNILYYNKVRKKVSTQRVHYNQFFYPLDSITNWNRIYGRNGFIQYQFILPKEKSYHGLEEILKRIADSGKGSFLAVLKLYGKANDNYLSFPFEGYSLSLDFKIEKGLFELLDALDEIVLKYSGRIYLAKDARVSKEVFEAGYPLIEEFRELRKRYKMNQKFNSAQSLRLDI